MRLDGRAFALTAGILWGAAIFIATLWLIVFGYQGQLMQQLDHFYFGYSVTLGGAVVGLIWGLVDGLVCGAIFAWLYNRLAGSGTA